MFAGRDVTEVEVGTEGGCREGRVVLEGGVWTELGWGFA